LTSPIAEVLGVSADVDSRRLSCRLFVRMNDAANLCGERVLVLWWQPFDWGLFENADTKGVSERVGLRWAGVLAYDEVLSSSHPFDGGSQCIDRLGPLTDLGDLATKRLKGIVRNVLRLVQPDLPIAFVEPVDLARRLRHRVPPMSIVNIG
jgi:hypothetical protein